MDQDEIGLRMRCLELAVRKFEADASIDCDIPTEAERYLAFAQGRPLKEPTDA